MRFVGYGQRLKSLKATGSSKNPYVMDMIDLITTKISIPNNNTCIRYLLQELHVSRSRGDSSKSYGH